MNLDFSESGHSQRVTEGPVSNNIFFVAHGDVNVVLQVSN